MSRPPVAVTLSRRHCTLPRVQSKRRRCDQGCRNRLAACPARSRCRFHVSFRLENLGLLSENLDVWKGSDADLNVRRIAGFAGTDQVCGPSFALIGHGGNAKVRVCAPPTTGMSATADPATECGFAPV